MTPLIRAYAQLVRLPNLPSALADVTLGALAVEALPARWPAFVLLLLSSACLYMAGMVWNDFFDVEQDRQERPERPIPSGRVSLRQAGVLGVALLVLGVVWAGLAGWVMWRRGEAAGMAQPVVLAVLLVGAILGYDALLKHTVLGPVAMGLCRFLNVLLGLSLSGAAPGAFGLHLALVVGVYIVGVTLFARTEALASGQVPLAVAAGLMLAALALGLALPVHKDLDTASPLFPYLLVAFGFILGFPISRAIRAPSPANVQAGVRRALIGLILLDAILAAGTPAGTAGLALLVLLLPALYLNGLRWLYAT